MTFSWNQLPTQLEILVQEGEVIDKPSDSEIDASLDAFETKIGTRLPQSYREFMHWFGPGALSEWFQICGPVPSRLSGVVADVYDSDKQRDMLEDPDGYWASTVTPDMLKRFILFASTEGGDWFFWDTADVRSKSDWEYGVYFHPRSSSRGKVKFIASSFKEFVLNVGLGEKYPFSEDVLETDKSFWPAWPTKPTR